MSATGKREVEREITRSLVGALERALAPGGSRAELKVARDAAELLALAGLDRLLAALEPHAGRTWPAEVGPAIERIRRVMGQGGEAGEVEAFRRADPALAALAEELSALEWSTTSSRVGDEGPSVSTRSAADALAGMTLAGDEATAISSRVRLTMPVAAAVRAAVEWLAGESGPRYPLELRGDDSVLEVGCELRDPAGVTPAHEVISGVDGNLGPSLAPTGGAPMIRWVVRVPAHGPRATYLMVAQGALKLALPWHAVLKLQAVRDEEIEARAARLGMPVLKPLASSPRRPAESPIVTLGHGLRRAWLVAERLVWRLSADPCEPDATLRSAGLDRAVVSDEGQIYGVADPRALLAALPLPPPPAMPENVAAMPEKAPAALTGERGASPAPPAESRTAAPEPAPVILTESSVRPLPAPAEGGRVAISQAPVARAPAARPRRVASPAAPVAQAAPQRKVLVAEDSITARIFLVRLLEQRGLVVQAVERAAELYSALALRDWGLIFVDVDLPDARGPELLVAVRERMAAGTALVALVRDEADLTAAAAAGVKSHLRKPVEPDALERVLERAGFPARGSR